MHTKGPWKAESVKSDGTLVYKRIKAANGKSVAFAGVYKGHDEEANARLIAEAPTLKESNTKLLQAVNDKDLELFESQELVAELLEALEEIVEVGTVLIVRGRLDPNNIGEAYSQADRIARKAIRKAKESE